MQRPGSDAPPQPAVPATARPSRVRDVVEQPVLEEMVVYSPTRQRVFGLNDSAAMIWALCDGTRTVSGIADQLGRRFGCPAAIFMPDVLSTIERLADAGLVEWT